MDFAVTSKADIEKLSVEQVVEKLSYVDKALRMLRQELGDKTALLGFTGSPWTLATFMMEGASVPKYSRALQLFREDQKTYFALAEKLTAAVTAYLQMQIATGIDALQIFDSHGGHLAATEFQEASRSLDERNHRQSRRQSSGHQFFARHAWQLAGSDRQRRECSRH